MGKVLKLLSFILCVIVSGCRNSSVDQQSYPYRIKGETITLTSTEWNSLWKRDVDNISLYAIEPSGNKVVYNQGVDYEVSENRIRRTTNSRIIDFAQHKVVYGENGKFRWASEPNRNPELTLPYQIYVDYSYADMPVTIRPSERISKSLFEKMEKGNAIKIVTSGTSITYGVDTYERYYNDSDIQTYPHLIAKALNAIYGIDCQIVNLSVNGGDVSQIQDISNIIAEKPDVVVFELGMNDHNGSNPPQEYYLNSLRKAIQECQSCEIDVILIGFFQQIESWEREYPQNTIAYNRILKELAAQYNIYFSDIYNSFETKISKDKLYKDYLGDYIHHPTSFGHQLYYLDVVPFFINKPYGEYQLLEILHR